MRTLETLFIKSMELVHPLTKKKKKHGIGKVESKETQPMNHPSSSFSGPVVVISIYFTD